MTDLTDNLRLILDQLPVAVWVGNVPDGTAAYANKEFERILLMPSVETSRIDDVPQTYGVFGHDNKPYPMHKLPFSRVLAEGRPVVVNDMVIRRPDRDISIRAFGSPLSRPDGSMSHVIVVFFDITAETSAQREREVVQERLSSVCNYAPIAIWATDMNGTITLSEGAGLASLGVKPGQLVGQDVFELYRDHPTVPGYLRRAMAGESVWYAANDGKATFESWLAPLRDQSGAIVGLAGFSNDVTEIRKLQSTVIQNDRVNAVGTLAASVAHEINNPLTYVLAHGDALCGELDTLETLLAKVDGAQSPAVRACLSRIRDELAPVRSGTAQIATITRDLRTFSRPDDASSAPVSVRAVIDAVLKLVRKEIEARASLVLELRDTPPVLGNETRLVQVILNLLVNALQATQAGGRKRQEIGIRTFVEGTRVVVEVSDSGPGVPAGDRERIFDPFYTTKEIGKGTGLGLFVCRNIVRDLGGEIAITEAPGGGALFRVTLPASAPAPAPAPATKASIAAAAGRHVLLIDDDALVLRALSVQLQRAGFRVTTATDGRTGLEILMGTDAVDLVYCDLMMKGLTGMDVAEAVATKAPAIARKLVFMTGGAFSPKAQEFVAQHSEHTVGKPFDIVAETLRRLS